MAKRLKPASAVIKESEPSRKYVSQGDVPGQSLEVALKVPRAISDSLAKAPSKPLRVAQAMDVSPGSSTFRQVCGAAIAYGLTEGGYNSEAISLTPLGRRIVAPTREGDEIQAMREAVLRPRIVRDFLTRYNGSKLPVEAIARNVLEELGVPTDRTRVVLGLILENANAVGFLRDLKGSRYVDLESAAVDVVDSDLTTSPDSALPSLAATTISGPDAVITPVTGNLSTRRVGNRVFITHGKNQEIVAQLKELLTFGGFTPVVALDNETVSKPVPDKVLDEMRTCDAAVIHVGSELKVMDTEGKEHRMLNQNVLIEIGAAMALYGRKFILLVEKGAQLPSNLQGLYEVRHEGGKLDYESTMKLLKAFNDFRS
jgi:Predicted nucleotide-binding protein containing TIR-like domain